MVKYKPAMVGDIVRIQFAFADEPPFEAEVLEVIDRFPHTPCIKYRRLDGMKASFIEEGPIADCDISYVQRVVRKGPVVHRPPVNIYQNYPNETFRHPTKKGVRCGWFSSLAIYYLGKVSGPVPRPLDERKLYLLYDRQSRPGSATWYGHFGQVAVQEKPFERFIRRNAGRLLKDRAAVRADQEAMDREMEMIDLLDADYVWSTVRDDMIEDGYPFDDLDDDLDLMDCMEPCGLGELLDV